MEIRFPVFILIHNLFVDKIMVIMRIRFRQSVLMNYPLRLCVSVLS